MWKKILLFSMLLNNIFSEDNFEPVQVHLSIGNNDNEFFVTWTTMNDTNESIVEYGIEEINKKASGYRTPMIMGNIQRTIYIHRVTLKNLTSGQKYEYRCGSNLSWSKIFWFNNLPTGSNSNWSPSFAVYGDLGVSNHMADIYVAEDMKKEMYDMVIHIGDFAYDFPEENGKRGDDFMEMIEPIAAYAPYMTCPGNHENSYNFSHYKQRFTMPGDTEGIYFSYNVGPIHFISFSTEVYYYLEYGTEILRRQFAWLQKDLSEANKPENRALRPWIITLGHRPMYCSNSNHEDCTRYENVIRVGLPLTKAYALESLFYQHGVDIEIWGHEHCYERMWPMYDYKVFNGSYEEPYVNPKGPIHITTGAAGNRENREPFFESSPHWSAMHSRDYGYTRMKAFNGTHIYMEQVSADKKGEVIDKFWVIKDNHGSYEM